MSHFPAVAPGIAVWEGRGFRRKGIVRANALNCITGHGPGLSKHHKALVVLGMITM